MYIRILLQMSIYYASAKSLLHLINLGLTELIVMDVIDIAEDVMEKAFLYPDKVTS